jgi:cytochrome oxidase Cu insertion factor (SCO1/SenC/PrrC family)
MLTARTRWLLLAAALAAGALIGLGFALVRPRASSSPTANPPTRPDATWAAGARRAPAFRLRDESGRPISLRSLRGRPVILTFIDPVCRNLCPLEARVLSDAVQSLPHSASAPIVSVSVNPWADTRANFALDRQKWRLGPSWRWAVGSYRQLAAVWRDYHIGVQVQRKVFAGIAVHDVAHTEGAYVIDADGFERALFLYPFRADDVAQVVKNVASS